MGVERLPRKMRIPTLVVAVGLLIIVALECDEAGVWLRMRAVWGEGDSWKMRRWAGIEGREIGLEF